MYHSKKKSEPTSVKYNRKEEIKKIIYSKPEPEEVEEVIIEEEPLKEEIQEGINLEEKTKSKFSLFK